MKAYKVLTNDLKSPYQNFQYELGKEYTCKDFDSSDKNCGIGFYAGGIESLLYRNLSRKNEAAFLVEVGGKSAGKDLKIRHEKQTIIRKLKIEEVKELALERGDELGFKLCEALFPINPLEIEPPKINDEIIKELRAWGSVGYSVGDSVGYSVWAYTSSLFLNIKKWKYIDHKKGVNPFQPGINLWKMGLVPSFDGKVWRLHGGKDAQILWKGELK